MYLQRIDLSIVKKDGYWDEAALLAFEKEARKEAEKERHLYQEKERHLYQERGEEKERHLYQEAGRSETLRREGGCTEYLYKEAKRIGSLLYRKMFAASRYSALAKAMLPIRQMGGIIDEYGMLQLTRLQYRVNPKNDTIVDMTAKDGGYYFDEKLEPNSLFLEEYARTVIEAYGRTGLDSPYVHQFRMYIDFHNISYIRTQYEGSTDLKKLKDYAKKTGQPLDYSSGSRLHNRKLRENLGKYEKQVNDKVKSRNGLSEFIVRMRSDEYGAAEQFVTQWDYLKVDKRTGRIDSNPESYTVREYKPIAETESFNYCKNDKIKVEGMRKLHTRLDVLPANSRTGYENDLKKVGKKYWAADKVYRERYR